MEGPWSDAQHRKKKLMLLHALVLFILIVFNIKILFYFIIANEGSISECNAWKNSKI